MTDVLEQAGLGALVLHTAPVFQLDDGQFFRFCQLNREWRIERSAEGDLIIMPPAGGSSSHGNAELIYLFQDWAGRDGAGRIFDSSGGFKLPNGAIRSPDVSWVGHERLNLLTNEEWERFLPLCPDFVLELRSPSDSLAMLEQKMEEYVRNGARLGWLLDRETKQAHVYQPQRQAQVLADPPQLSGDPVLKGFTLDLPRIWTAMAKG